MHTALVKSYGRKGPEMWRNTALGRPFGVEIRRPRRRIVFEPIPVPTERVFVKLQKVAVAATSVLVGLAGLFSARQVVAQSSSDARIRVAHLSPDAPAVDIYIDGKKRLTNVPYEGVSDYVALPQGAHTFEVRATGTTPDSPAAFKESAQLGAGKAYTVAAVGKVAQLKGAIYSDSLNPPAAGKAKIRMLHAAPDLGRVDLGVKGSAPLFSKVAFPTASPYAEVSAGSYDLEARKAGSNDALLSATVPLAPGSIYTVTAIGGGSQPTRLKVVRDFDGTASGNTTAATTKAASASTVASTKTAATELATTETATTAATKPATTEPATTEPATTRAPVTTKRPATTAATRVLSATETSEPADDEDVGGSDGSNGQRPVGGVGTGAGGLSPNKPGGQLAILIAAGALAIGAGAVRRRLVRSGAR